MTARAVAAGLLILLALPSKAGGQDLASEPVRGDDDPEFTELLERVGDRVRQYYRDLENLAWTTTVRHEVFENDWIPKVEPRDLIFESIVLLEPPPDDVPVPFFVREQSELTHVDGAPVDPGHELEPEAYSGFPYSGFQLSELLFLVPEFRANFDVLLSNAGTAELDGRPAFVIDAEWTRTRSLGSSGEGTTYRFTVCFRPVESRSMRNRTTCSGTIRKPSGRTSVGC